MKNNAIYDKLYTKRDVVSLINSIEAVETALFEKNSRSNEIIRDFVNNYPYIMNSMEETDVSDHLKELKALLETTTYVHITLSFLPSLHFLELLKSTFKKRYQFSAIFDIKVNRDILGGCVIDYKGFYRDLSLRSKLRAYLNTRKDAIISKL